MSILDTIKKRYSVRKYKNTPVEQEKIDAILEAAHCAPTAANMQPQKVLVVQKPENLAKFSAGANTYNAPLVMLVCADLNEVWVRPYDGKNMVDIDASIITDHMMLTATDLGLGSCWITYFDPKAIRTAFNLPDNLIPVNILAIGYAADQPQSPDRHSETRKALNQTISIEVL
ncbi:MAG: nitroreductase family protein [Lachnospiraceae bacterium]